jgi:hypothetical protein
MGKEGIKIILEILIIFLHMYIIFVSSVSYDNWCLETLVLRNVNSRENFWKTFAIFNYFLSNFIWGFTVPNLAMFPVNLFNFFPLYVHITRIPLRHWVVDRLLIRAHVSNTSDSLCLLVIYYVIRYSVLLRVASLWRNFQDHCSTGVMDSTPALSTDKVM